MGSSVGRFVGWSVIGTLDGSGVGSEELGATLGSSDGSLVGRSVVATLVGASVGMVEGSRDSASNKRMLGNAVGPAELASDG